MEYFEDRATASDVSPQGFPARVMLRLALTLLIGIPACLTLLILFALEAPRAIRSSSRERTF
jgi:hypothetical protein